MPCDRQFRLRVFYKKLGRFAMLSHLEIARTLERYVRRSGLPFAVTNGYSPHMKITFGPALPVGVGGDREIFDVFLTDYLSCIESLSALKNVCVDGLDVFDCKYVDTANKVSSTFSFSCYVVEFTHPLSGVDYPSNIVVKKGDKEKTLTVDEFLYDKPTINSKDSNKISFILESKNTGSLRVDDFVNQLVMQPVDRLVCLDDISVVGITRKYVF